MRRSLFAAMSSFALLACQHAAPATTPIGASVDGGTHAGLPANASASADAGVAEPDPAVLARSLSEEAHALLKAEGDLFWTRWTTGQGALPATAAAGHDRLFERPALKTIAAAADGAQGANDALALRLLHGQLATRAIARVAVAESDALETARTLLSFTPEGADRPQHERDLDRLLLDEPSASKRARLAIAEAKAAAALLPLLQERDAAYEKARRSLGLPSWAALISELHRATPDELAALAEETLRDTQEVASRAVSELALRNLGLPADRLQRADLPRLLRSTSADAEFPQGQGWSLARKLLAAVGVDEPALDRIVLDAEPRPAKGARPLALLVDPPRDVRLSYRGLGGLDEQTAMLHESARAAGGVLIDPALRWELTQLGDGAAAEGVARLIEGLAGEPGWLRAATRLRGEQLDDLVHTEATRRLLAARRAAAMVLFEVQRREGKRSADEVAKLYRGLLQRATFALYTDEDSRRWPLEADSWIRSAATLQGEVIAAQLELLARRELGDRAGAAGALDRPRAGEDEEEEDDEEDGGSPAPPTAGSGGDAPGVEQPPAWWSSTKTGDFLRRVWSLGRSASAGDVLRVVQMTSLDPYLLAAVAAEQLGYRAPERPPEPPRPNYKELRDDRRPRKRKKARRAR